MRGTCGASLSAIRSRRWPTWRSLIAGLGGCLLITVGVVALPPAAKAGDGYNDYLVTGLPQWVTGPTPFTVSVDGPLPVCAMTYNGVRLAAPPWSFTYIPPRGSTEVVVDECDGWENAAYLNVEPAFAVAPQVISDSALASREVNVRNNTPEPATAQLTDGRGMVVAAVEIPAYETGGIPVARRPKRTESFTLTLTAGALTQSFPVTIARGWSLLRGSDGATFAPCSQVTWHYDPQGQPVRASTFKKDIVAALHLLSKRTGLKFQEVATREGSQLRFEWGNLGRRGPAGIGGAIRSDDTATGQVTINTANPWPTDAYRGLGTRSTRTLASAGRGWLIVHETLHALGFGHVADPKSIMHPVNTGQHAFTRGDLEGVRTLYPLKNCP